MFVHYGLLIKQMFVSVMAWLSVVIKSSAHGRLFTYMLLPTADDAFFGITFIIWTQKATQWKAKPFKTLSANLYFFSDRRLIVFQKSHAFRFLLFLLNKRNAVENLFYILILAQRQSSEHRAMVARPSSDRRTTVKRRSLRKYKLSLFAKRTVHEGPAWGKWIHSMNGLIM